MNYKILPDKHKEYMLPSQVDYMEKEIALQNKFNTLFSKIKKLTDEITSSPSITDPIYNKQYQYGTTIEAVKKWGKEGKHQIYKGIADLKRAFEINTEDLNLKGEFSTNIINKTEAKLTNNFQNLNKMPDMSGSWSSGQNVSKEINFQREVFTNYIDNDPLDTTLEIAINNFTTQHNELFSKTWDIITIDEELANYIMDELPYLMIHPLDDPKDECLEWRKFYHKKYLSDPLKKKCFKLIQNTLSQLDAKNFTLIEKFQRIKESVKVFLIKDGIERTEKLNANFNWESQKGIDYIKEAVSKWIFEKNEYLINYQYIYYGDFFSGNYLKTINNNEYVDLIFPYQSMEKLGILEDYELAFESLNELRTLVGLSLLNENYNLNISAMNHSVYMNKHDEIRNDEDMNKIGATGVTFLERAKQVEYTGDWVHGYSYNKEFSTIEDELIHSFRSRLPLLSPKISAGGFGIMEDKICIAVGNPFKTETDPDEYYSGPVAIIYPYDKLDGGTDFPMAVRTTSLTRRVSYYDVKVRVSNGIGSWGWACESREVIFLEYGIYGYPITYAMTAFSKNENPISLTFEEETTVETITEWGQTQYSYSYSNHDHHHYTKQTDDTWKNNKSEPVPGLVNEGEGVILPKTPLKADTVYRIYMINTDGINYKRKFKTHFLENYVNVKSEDIVYIKSGAINHIMLNPLYGTPVHPKIINEPQRNFVNAGGSGVTTTAVKDNVYYSFDKVNPNLLLINPNLELGTTFKFTFAISHYIDEKSFCYTLPTRNRYITFIINEEATSDQYKLITRFKKYIQESVVVDFESTDPNRMLKDTIFNVLLNGEYYSTINLKKGQTKIIDYVIEIPDNNVNEISIEQDTIDSLAPLELQYNDKFNDPIPDAISLIVQLPEIYNYLEDYEKYCDLYCNSIAQDDILNIDEINTTININGYASGGISAPGDIVEVTLGSNTYSTNLTGLYTWNVDIPGSELQDYTSINVKIICYDDTEEFPTEITHLYTIQTDDKKIYDITVDKANITLYSLIDSEAKTFLKIPFKVINQSGIATLPLTLTHLDVELFFGDYGYQKIDLSNITESEFEYVLEIPGDFTETGTKITAEIVFSDLIIGDSQTVIKVNNVLAYVNAPAFNTISLGFENGIFEEIDATNSSFPDEGILSVDANYMLSINGLSDNTQVEYSIDNGITWTPNTLSEDSSVQLPEDFIVENVLARTTTENNNNVTILHLYDIHVNVEPIVIPDPTPITITATLVQKGTDFIKLKFVSSANVPGDYNGSCTLNSTTHTYLIQENTTESNEIIIENLSDGTEYIINSNSNGNYETNYNVDLTYVPLTTTTDAIVPDPIINLSITPIEVKTQSCTLKIVSDTQIPNDLDGQLSINGNDYNFTITTGNTESGNIVILDLIDNTDYVVNLVNNFTLYENANNVNITISEITIHTNEIIVVPDKNITLEFDVNSATYNSTYKQVQLPITLSESVTEDISLNIILVQSDNSNYDVGSVTFNAGETSKLWMNIGYDLQLDETYTLKFETNSNYPKVINGENIVLVYTEGTLVMPQSTSLQITVDDSNINYTKDQNGNIVANIPFIADNIISDSYNFFIDYNNTTLTATMSTSTGVEIVGLIVPESSTINIGITIDVSTVPNYVGTTTSSNYELVVPSEAELFPEEQVTLKTWNIMVYINADNNLEDAGIGDLNEMESLQLPDNVKMTFMIDRNPYYDETNGNWTTARRGLIVHDTDFNNLTSTDENNPLSQYEDLGELNMGDSDTLTGFIDWSKASYPADNYALVLWNHGLSVYGASVDDTTQEEGGDFYMSLPELRQGIEFSSVTKFKLIGFDMCVMASLDVGYTVQDLCDVTVFSQNNEPGEGWDYKAMIQGINDLSTNNEQLTANNFATLITTSYIEFYGSTPTPITLSSIDNSKFNNVISKMNDYMIALSSSTTTIKTNIKNSFDSLDGGKIFSDSVNNELFDIQEYLNYNITNIPSLATAANNYLTALNDCIISNESNTDNRNGLSMYVPYDASSMYWDYKIEPFYTDTDASVLIDLKTT